MPNRANSSSSQGRRYKSSTYHSNTPTQNQMPRRTFSHDTIPQNSFPTFNSRSSIPSHTYSCSTSSIPTSSSQQKQQHQTNWLPPRNSINNQGRPHIQVEIDPQVAVPIIVATQPPPVPQRATSSIKDESPMTSARLSLSGRRRHSGRIGSNYVNSTSNSNSNNANSMSSSNRPTPPSTKLSDHLDDRQQQPERSESRPSILRLKKKKKQKEWEWEWEWKKFRVRRVNTSRNTHNSYDEPSPQYNDNNNEYDNEEAPAEKEKNTDSNFKARRLTSRKMSKNNMMDMNDPALTEAAAALSGSLPSHVLQGDAKFQSNTWNDYRERIDRLADDDRFMDYLTAPLSPSSSARLPPLHQPLQQPDSSNDNEDNVTNTKEHNRNGQIGCNPLRKSGGFMRNSASTNGIFCNNTNSTNNNDSNNSSYPNQQGNNTNKPSTSQSTNSNPNNEHNNSSPNWSSTTTNTATSSSTGIASSASGSSSNDSKIRTNNEKDEDEEQNAETKTEMEDQKSNKKSRKKREKANKQLHAPQLAVNKLYPLAFIRLLEAHAKNAAESDAIIRESESFHYNQQRQVDEDEENTRNMDECVDVVFDGDDDNQNEEAKDNSNRAPSWGMGFFSPRNITTTGAGMDNELERQMEMNTGMEQEQRKCDLRRRSYGFGGWRGGGSHKARGFGMGMRASADLSHMIGSQSSRHDMRDSHSTPFRKHGWGGLRQSQRMFYEEEERRHRQLRQKMYRPSNKTRHSQFVPVC